MAGANLNVASAALGQKAVAYQHPVYQEWAPEWRKLAHIREGSGGFLDGTYLIAHPREWEDYTQPVPIKPTKKLKARRAIACYENFAATIIEAKKSVLFREQPTRRVGEQKEDAQPTPLQNWWEDVDRSGCHVDDFMAQAWDHASTFGHVILYVDRPKNFAGPTGADTKAPMVSLYTPLDLTDWLEDEYGNLTAVKLMEAVPRDDFTSTPERTDFRVRIVTTTYWALYDQGGKLLEQGQHRLGRLPIVFLYGKRRPMLPRIGQSVLGDPDQYIDLYNLTSEGRELLRNQTFSILNVPLGSGPDRMTVEEAKTLMGSTTGTDNVLFSGESAGYVTASAENVSVYVDVFNQRLRHIYRLAGIQWEADSKDAEATGSLKLKREDMNTRLSAYADEIEKAEYELADLFYRAQYGADAGPKRLEKEDVEIRYPDTFDVTPFDVVLEQAQAAQSLGMPPEFLKALKKRLISKFLPDLSQTELKTLQDAIEKMPDLLSPVDAMKQRLNAVAGALKDQSPVELAGSGQPQQ